MSQTPTKPGSEESPSTLPEGFRVWRPGQVDYRDAVALQEELVDRRPQWPFDLLILLEHPPVITLGRSTNKDNLHHAPEVLLEAGIDCVETRRGGDVTLHNPGQLVGYPVVDLNHYQRDIHLYLRMLERVLIATLADFGISADIVAGKTGVWTASRKIASIGVAVRRWISYHGFALNISNDLSMFDNIVPCGLADVTMTSMSRELDKEPDLNDITTSLIGHFSRIMQRPMLGNYNDPKASP